MFDYRHRSNIYVKGDISEKEHFKTVIKEIDNVIKHLKRDRKRFKQAYTANKNGEIFNLEWEDSSHRGKEDETSV